MVHCLGFILDKMFTFERVSVCAGVSVFVPVCVGVSVFVPVCAGVCRCACVCACHTLMLEDSLWELELSSIVCVLGIKLRPSGLCAVASLWRHRRRHCVCIFGCVPLLSWELCVRMVGWRLSPERFMFASSKCPECLLLCTVLTEISNLKIARLRWGCENGVTEPHEA